MVNDTVADCLTRIRNAQRVGHRAVRIPSSKMVGRILEVLKTEGFIQSFENKKDKKEKFVEFEVLLKYYSNGDPLMGFIRRVSSPGRRVYLKTAKFPRILQGLGIAVVSTSQGVMSDREARKRKIGGEVLAYVG